MDTASINLLNDLISKLAVMSGDVATQQNQLIISDLLTALSAKVPAGLTVASGALKVQPSIISASSVTITTSASIATTSVKLVDPNANRIGFILWNNSANSAYITLGAVSTSSTPAFILPTFASLVWIYPIAYKGAISAIRNAGTGTITAYELIA